MNKKQVIQSLLKVLTKTNDNLSCLHAEMERQLEGILKFDADKLTAAVSAQQSLIDQAHSSSVELNKLMGNLGLRWNSADAVKLTDKLPQPWRDQFEELFTQYVEHLTNNSALLEKIAQATANQYDIIQPLMSKEQLYDPLRLMR